LPWIRIGRERERDIEGERAREGERDKEGEGERDCQCWRSTVSSYFVCARY
jgi:hypothetical protein